MTPYAKLRRDPASKDLFNKRITTLKGLLGVLESSSFLAIDTEHVAVTSEADRVLHQVGLAYYPMLIQPRSSLSDTKSLNTSKPSLQEFYDKNRIRGLTLNVNVSKEKEDELISVRGVKGFPVRRSLRFGQEQQHDLERLEAAIINFIQGCDSKGNLVLIGFEMAAEWTYIFTVFPRIMRFFSAWMDVRDIAADITSSVGVIPGLNQSLKLFGYQGEDLKPGRTSPGAGIADNAGDDAVATCALADALLFPRNQEKLKLRQECGRIARVFTKKKGFQTPQIRDSFVVIIRSQGPLPFTIDSATKLARRFFDYSPQAAGVMSADVAFIAFGNQEKMNAFIAAVNGVAQPTGEILSVERYAQENQLSQKDGKAREEKQKLRESGKLDKVEGDIGDLGDLFS
ncbi:hypothetical protein NW762_010111 [Fusarium torreyae]|uniref:Uncharacterized protein n=1 Tax=Fusarium torreyae TaxID=1237075 RepID=A0A9W8RSM4_9HYPO|nr:hypothetical protein NW762_010111 [Fusarium torreyae]